MKLSNTEYAIKFICETEPGKPIYSKDLANKMVNEFSVDYKKASADVAVALNRIIKNNLCDDLRCYQKGIYYKTVNTPFGEKNIDKECLIKDKYIKEYDGYESGNSLLHRLGLTTQMPNERVIVTNYAGDCARKDKKLGITIKPPKIKITKDNRDYLMILDTLNLMDNAPIDVDNPYTIILEFINTHKLKYQKLLAYALHYYNQNTILKLANTAAVEEKAR